MIYRIARKTNHFTKLCLFITYKFGCFLPVCQFYTLHYFKYYYLRMAATKMILVFCSQSMPFYYTYCFCAHTLCKRIQTRFNFASFLLLPLYFTIVRCFSAPTNTLQALVYSCVNTLGYLAHRQVNILYIASHLKRFHAYSLFNHSSQNISLFKPIFILNVF